MTDLGAILDDYLYSSTTTVERGSKFENLVKSFLTTDTQWSGIYDHVWRWDEWPGRTGHDVGIDLVARERDTGNLTAIQCKFYDPQHQISKGDVDTFLSASGKQGFAGRLFVSTTDKWGSNAEEAIRNQQIPVNRVGLTELFDSSIDWSQFADTHDVSDLKVKTRHELRTHQLEALNAVREGFETHDRGKLIMACGTGKTFTSLRIAEDLVGTGGTVLFLVPSIALASQALKEWSIQADVDLRTFVVCSDASVGKRNPDEDISVVDLPVPATTDPARLIAGFNATDASDRMTVVFSTYQSIDVVHQAQQMGFPEFDLVLCDEAHRTTGVTLAGQDESAFVRVHDEDYLRAGKRLYMTATPRIYAPEAKAKASADVTIASMDDEASYGPELYRIGFGRAVSAGILTDYRVLVLAVDEGMVSRTLQGALSDPDNKDLQLDDAAKIVGCWNAMAKRGHAEHDFSSDPEPMRRAVAFSRSIKDSKRFTESFGKIVDEYTQFSGLVEAERQDPEAVRLLPASVQHVDGSDNMVHRANLLSWLKEDTGALEDGGEARILSNAKCLSEGVDVPALDAVMFLNPRKSQVDVVQSVGRVMRRDPQGRKKYGYIILPIVVPAGVKPEDALRDNERYRVVWEVLQALRAHDERFDAMVNQIELNKNKSDRIQIIGVGGAEESESSGSNQSGEYVQSWLDLDALGDFRNAMYAQIVKKVGSRQYWEDWAKDVAVIAEKHRARLLGLLEAGTAAEEFEAFLDALRRNLNGSISRNDAIDMLSQHMITAPIFQALFADYDFATHNPVSQVMEKTLRALEGNNLEAETEQLEKFYDSVRVRVAGIDNAEGRQKIIKDLYERFFKLAFPRAADALGIVYTPTEVVDFIIRSVDHLLRTELKVPGISAEGVHVLDPFTGTGTFIVRLLQSGLISPHDLARKYASELHANEIMLLAYYIAAINIESTFHDLMKELAPETTEGELGKTLDQGDAEYTPFDGIVLTDTFQMHEDDDLDDGTVFTRNSSRATAQKKLDVRVIIGNPPYSVGQTSGNDNNANLKYPTLDRAIETTYAARSTATLKNSLYDSYIRAIRWASDRVGDSGIIGFVTNGGFIDANTADGLRKTLADEFASIYVFNLRGNARTAGEQRKKEAGNVFGGGARTTVGVFFLVKNPEHIGTARLHYRDIGDYLSREDKLEIVGKSTIDAIEWQTLTPNEAGDWTNQRSDDFDSYQPIGNKTATGTVFGTISGGIKTNRDAWVYNYSRTAVEQNVNRMVSFYNSQVDEFAAFVKEQGITDPKTAVNDYIDTDPTKFSWDRADRQRLPKNEHYELHPEALRTSAYRPFTRQYLWFDSKLNNTVYRIPSLFPTPALKNYGFAVNGIGTHHAFGALATDRIPNLYLMHTGQFFARYTYEKVDATKTEDLFAGLHANEDIVDGYKRVDNITNATLANYHHWYGAEVSKDDIFVFIYGLLHSPDYRTRFEADLKRSLPRIPRIATEDFAAFRDAGQRLMDLHIGYENVDPYPLEITGDQPTGAGSADLYDWFRIEKLKWADKGKSTITYNSRIVVSGIPAEVHDYFLGTRSAIEWIIDRYRATTDKASGIVNDPNDWSKEVGNPRYILDLIGKVTRVSVETVRIVKNLPPLRIHETQDWK